MCREGGLPCHEGSINCLAIDAGRIVSGGDDGQICYWDLSAVEAAEVSRATANLASCFTAATDRLTPPNPLLPFAATTGVASSLASASSLHPPHSR